MRIRGTELCDVEISGELNNVIVNGVDVAPLVDRELNRRMPDRAKMRPDDVEGFKEAWSLTDEQLASQVSHTEPGWPKVDEFPLKECLLIVLSEEWEHRRYAERDLAALGAPAARSSDVAARHP